MESPSYFLNVLNFLGIKVVSPKNKIILSTLFLGVLKNQNIIQLKNQKFDLNYNCQKFPNLKKEINRLFFILPNTNDLNFWESIFHEHLFILLRKYLIDCNEKHILIFDHFYSIQNPSKQIKTFEELKKKYYLHVFSNLEHKLNTKRLNLINEDKNITWEWRAFWPESCKKILVNIDFLGELSLNDFKEKEISDLYINFRHKSLNIKIRHNNLVVKPILQVQDSFTAYDKKKVFKFPLDNKDLYLIFPSLENKNIENIEDFISALERSNYQFNIINVEKKIYRYKFKYKKIQIELSRISVKNLIWYSLCFESNDKESIKDLKDLVVDQNIIEGSYPIFIQKIDI